MQVLDHRQLVEEVPAPLGIHLDLQVARGHQVGDVDGVEPVAELTAAALVHVGLADHLAVQDHRDVHVHGVLGRGHLPEGHQGRGGVQGGAPAATRKPVAAQPLQAAADGSLMAAGGGEGVDHPCSGLVVTAHRGALPVAVALGPEGVQGVGQGLDLLGATREGDAGQDVEGQGVRVHSGARLSDPGPDLACQHLRPVHVAGTGQHHGHEGLQGGPVLHPRGGVEGLDVPEVPAGQEHAVGVHVQPLLLRHRHGQEDVGGHPGRGRATVPPGEAAIGILER